MNNRKKASCVGDLIKYRGETIYKIREGLDKIKDNKGLASIIINAMKKNKGMAGMTIEQLLTNLETSSSIDIFSFKVNDHELYKLFDESNNMNIEVYMDDLYFQSKAMMDQALQGFRIKKMPYSLLVEKEKDKWLRWFEKNLKDYHPLNQTIKSLIEE